MMHDLYLEDLERIEDIYKLKKRVMDICSNYYTCRELEEKTGVDHCTISRFLKGKNIKLESFFDIYSFINKEVNP